MRTRSTAALIVLTLVSWVGSFAQSTDGALNQIAASPEPVATHHHEHDCCAHQEAFSTRATPPLQPVNLPCGDGHPCCVRPAPQNVASLPSTSNYQRTPNRSRIFEATASVLAGPATAFGRVNPHAVRNDFSLGTILRI